MSCFCWVLMFTVVSMTHAQTITVKPSSPTTALGTTLQFSAQINGVAGAAAWSAGGAIGGSAVAGTITPAGLYTAPTLMPGQNPVQIKAAAGGKSATVYVYLLTPGPTLTSVSPNPLGVGSFTMTLQGSGFLPGAMIYDTYSGIQVQLPTTFVTANTVTASGWQGAAPSASFSVKNPGSDYSNSLAVPITAASRTPTR